MAKPRQQTRATEEARLALIVTSSHDAIIGETGEGVITSWNPAAERLYGYTAPEMIGRNVDVLYPAERMVQEMAISHAILAGRRVDRYLAGRVGKDRLLPMVSLTASPITDLAGSVVGIASASRELSDQERAEESFRGLLEASPDSIVGVDRDGRIVLVNAQTVRMFGYSRTELIGEPVEMLLPAAAGAAHPAHRATFRSDPRPRPMGIGLQLAGRRQDGTEFPAEIALSTVGTGDDLTAVAFVRDVTDRLPGRAEKERRQTRAVEDLLGTQAAAERSQSQLSEARRLAGLGQLAGGVAHEFNNLIAIILNYTAFVAEEVAACAGPRGASHRQAAREDLEAIRSAAHRAARLTNQLSAAGRQTTVRPEQLSLNEVVSHTEQSLRRTLGEHVTFVTCLPADLWLVTADPSLVEEVLLDLAANAHDAMPAGGTLIIDTANVILDEDYVAKRPRLRAGRNVRLRVTDSGTGMAAEVAEHVFEPFFTTKPVGAGSGLGLAAVQGIIAQAEGHVEVHSKPGIGTTLTTLLPAVNGHPDHIERRTPPRPAPADRSR
jgi:PAS domain S-box-containing protein